MVYIKDAPPDHRGIIIKIFVKNGIVIDAWEWHIRSGMRYCDINSLIGKNINLTDYISKRDYYEKYLY